mmetsp:Transcript_49234/g.107089  ORF Transcript_49234/g.107089 Transcript_49234/m.107089 type:complete len:479 (-) Transcript_49234:82-1518(-)
MDEASLRALHVDDLASLRADCGLAKTVHGASHQELVAELLEWQKCPDAVTARTQTRAAPVEKAKVIRKLFSRRRYGFPATPARAPPQAPAAPCERCGQLDRGGLCACSFLVMDPLRPGIKALALVGLAADTLACPGLGSLEVELDVPTLLLGEGIELRMVRRSEPKQHIWPRNFHVWAAGREILRIDAPREGHKRVDAPEEVTQHLPPGPVLLRVAADGGEINVADFVLCVVQVGPLREVPELVSEALARVPASSEATARLWMTLCEAEAEAEGPGNSEGVECASPWLQPLSCPLTRDRLSIPSRGLHCRHLRCFDLRAFLETSVRTKFHRRWRCPVCDCPLPPSELIVCGLTKQLLEEFLEADEAQLGPALRAALGASNDAELSTLRTQVPETSRGTKRPALEIGEARPRGASCDRRRWRRATLCVQEPETKAAKADDALMKRGDGRATFAAPTGHPAGWGRRLQASTGCGAVAALD